MRKGLNRVVLYTAVIIGTILLYLFFKLNALYFFIFLVIAIIYLIAKNNKESRQDKKFLIMLILLIFISRFILSLFVMNARGAELTQDEGLYSKKALLKAYDMKGVKDLEKLFYEHFDDYDMMIKNYGYNAYTYILTWFYYLFGYQIQAARLINIYINVMIFLLIFYVGRKLFNPRVAKISSAIFAFFPSITLWSTMIGVDMVVLLCISTYIFSLIKILEKFEFKWLWPMVFSILIVDSIRRYVAVALILSAGIVSIFKIVGRLTRMVKLAFIALTLLLIYLLLHLSLVWFLEEKFQEVMPMIIQHQKNFAAIDDSGYLVYPKHCYEGTRALSARDIFEAYFKGMSYVLFSPFPWRIESKLQLMAYPQVILWYFMMPFILYGFYIGFSTNKLPTLSIFLYAFLVFSIFALMEGNIGALFRHRDMVTPYLLIYFAGGICSLFNRHTGERFKKEGR